MKIDKSKMLTGIAICGVVCLGIGIKFMMYRSLIRGV